MDEKTMIENRSVLTHDTAEYEALVEAMRFATQTTDKLIDNVTPSLLGERYLTTEQVMTHFHISRRALQNYRDKGIIPYTSIGGTLLYPESKINEVLERNYYKPAGCNELK
ncbi:helix-turn-helix domain-containing protein [Alistipes timonensis]